MKMGRPPAAYGETVRLRIPKACLAAVMRIVESYKKKVKMAAKNEPQKTVKIKINGVEHEISERVADMFIRSWTTYEKKK